jgi:beta-glucanase (GH16 family)
MRTSVKILAVLGILSLIGLSVPVTANATVAKDKILWTQSFNEKAGTMVSNKIFSYDTGNGMGWGNNEQEYYTNKAANISSDGKGNLVIKAIKLNPDNPKDQSITNWCGACVFSSAKVTTRGKLGFKYGSLSARIQIPTGTGMWPAFWLLGVPRKTCDGWPSCGEIDIMEARGSDPFHSVSTLHGPGYSGGGGLTHYFSAGDIPNNNGDIPLSDGFHIYRVDWLPNSIKFYVDNQLVGGETKSTVSPNSWVFNAEFYLILNLATGGDFDGGALDDTIQSASLKIDWLKYTTLKGQGTLIKH